jgi:hypothetical protein
MASSRRTLAKKPTENPGKHFPFFANVLRRYFAGAFIWVAPTNEFDFIGLPPTNAILLIGVCQH